MNDFKDEWLIVGKVIGTHGLRGDLKIKPFSGISSVLLEAQRVLFQRKFETPISRLPTRATFHKGTVLMHLSGLDHIDAAQAMVGCDVLMSPDEFPQLPEDEFYWFELEGIVVEDRTRGHLGILEDLLTTGAHDIYVVNGPFGEVLIPAVEEFVIRIDMENRRMTVDLPEGLVPEPDEL